MDPLLTLLSEDEVTEICINRPGEAYVERYSGWTCQPMPFATFAWCMQFAKLVANYTKQRISAKEPLLSATLPTGARVQLVIPPATEEGKVSITIRRPSTTLWTLDQLAEKGTFADVSVLPRTPAVPSIPKTLSAMATVSCWRCCAPETLSPSCGALCSCARTSCFRALPGPARQQSARR